VSLNPLIWVTRHCYLGQTTRRRANSALQAKTVLEPVILLIIGFHFIHNAMDRIFNSSERPNHTCPKDKLRVETVCISKPAEVQSAVDGALAGLARLSFLVNQVAVKLAKASCVIAAMWSDTTAIYLKILN
jgi:hypothetical protein